MLSDEPPRLPARLFRVVWDQGYGWPVLTRRERTQRTYGDAQRAADQVAAIKRWPLHHRLIGVYVTDTDWREIDPDQLPAPRERSES